MLRIFLSSTYSDISDVRRKILVRLSQSVYYSAMEDFVSTKTPHDLILNHPNLSIPKADYCIYLLTVSYGTKFYICPVENNCICPCQYHNREKIEDYISYTHCELRLGKYHNIPRLTYFFGDGWAVYDEIIKGSIKDIAEGRDEIHNNIEYLCNIQEEVKDESPGRLTEDELSRLFKHLVSDILYRYSKYESNTIKFENFVGRHTELKELYDLFHSESRLLLWGVGGIGKTTVAEILILFTILETGKNVVIFSKHSEYISGSGYQSQKIYKISKYYSEKLTLERIISELGIFEDKIEDNIKITVMRPEEKREIIFNYCNDKNIILFIDDIHEADIEVQKLFNCNRKDTLLIATSREGNLDLDCPSREINRVTQPLELIHHFEKKIFQNNLGGEYSQQLAEISDGYPLFSNILVRYVKYLTDFNKQMTLPQILSRIQKEKPNNEGLYEMWNRIIPSILEPNEIDMLCMLSQLDSDISFNIDSNIACKVWDNLYSKGQAKQIINSLSQKGFIESKQGNSNQYTFTHHQIADLCISATEINPKFFSEENYLKEQYNFALKYYEYILEQVDEPNKQTSSIEILYYKILLGFEITDITSLLSQYSSECKYDRDSLRIATCAEKMLDTASMSDIDTITLLIICGHMYVVLKQFTKAEEKLNQALECCEKLKYNINILYQPVLEKQVLALKEKCCLFEVLGCYDEALKTYDNALFLVSQYPRLQNCSSGELYLNKGRVFWKQKRYAEAETEYVKVENLLHNMKGSQKNLISHQQSSFSNDDLQYIRIKANLYNNWGLLYHSMAMESVTEDNSEYVNKAKQYYIKACNLKKKDHLFNPNNPDVTGSLAKTYYNLGRFYSKLKKNLEMAEKYYSLAIILRKDLETKGIVKYYIQIADGYVNLANLYDDHKSIFDKDLNIIEDLYMHALTLGRQLQKYYPEGVDRYHLEYTLINIGEFYCKSMDKPRTAEPYYLEALDICRRQVSFNPQKQESKHLYCKCLNALKIIYAKIGDRDKCKLYNLELNAVDSQ